MIALLLMALAGAAPPPVEPPAPPRLPEVVERALPGGGRLLTLERHHLPMAHVAVVVPWPGALAPAREQLAAGLATSLLGAGAGGIDGVAFTEAMQGLGASWRVSMSGARLQASVELPSQGLDEGLDLILQALIHPRLPAREARRLARRWADWREEVWLDIRRVHERALNHAWFPEGHPSRHSALPADLRRLRARHVRRLIERVLAEGRVGAVAVGELDGEALHAALSARLAAFEGRAMPASLPALRPAPALWLVDRPGFSVVELGVLTPAPALEDAEHPLAALLAELLGGGFTSRLVQDLRERRGLVYAVGAELEAWPGHGRLRFTAELPEAQALEALSALLAQLDRAAGGGITPEELDAARHTMWARVNEQLSTNAGAAAWLTELLLRGLRVHDERAALRRVAAASPEALDALAARLLAAEGRVIVITGDREALEPALERAGWPLDRVVSAQRLAEQR